MGAWGVEPFENDSALDWLHGVQKAVEKALYCHRRKGKYGSTGQHEALAAIVLVKCIPSLASSNTQKSGYATTFAEEALVSLKLLEDDEQFVNSWRCPKEYLAVLAREKRGIQRIVRAQRREEKERLAKCVRRVKRMSKAQRDKEMKTGASMFFGRYWREAFKIVDGRDLPEPKPLRRRRIRRRKKALGKPTPRVFK